MSPINQHMVQTSNTENPSNKTSNVKEVKFCDMFNRIDNKPLYIEVMRERFESVRDVIVADPTGEHYLEYIRNTGDNMSEADKHKAIEAYQCYIKNNTWG
jgi:hypothetical protein